jgi:hypothetical protein
MLKSMIVASFCLAGALSSSAMAAGTDPFAQFWGDYKLVSGNCPTAAWITHMSVYSTPGESTGEASSEMMYWSPAFNGSYYEEVEVLEAGTWGGNEDGPVMNQTVSGREGFAKAVMTMTGINSRSSRILTMSRESDLVRVESTRTSSLYGQVVIEKCQLTFKPKSL